MLSNLSTEDRIWAESVCEKLLTKLEAQHARLGTAIPFVPRDGHYLDLDSPDGIYWWTNGFWPGILWQLYHATGQEKYRATAQNIEARLDQALQGFEGLHHDVGFLWQLSAVAGYRLTQSSRSRVRALHAANLLAGRYNPAGRFLRAWNGEHIGWMIADSMMNLPLLYWASDETGDPRFRFLAQSHADTCARVSVRGDGSCNHISVFDPATGQCLEHPAGQGYASGSSWSRGQAWILYGFALSYFHTGKAEYLDVAKQTAHYFISNLAVTGWLPLVDFRAPAEPVRYDSTAAMCACCGLLEIAGHVGKPESAFYTRAALQILRACEAAFCNWDPLTDGVVHHGTGSYHGTGVDADAPIIYGDYYFTEAVLRLLGKGFRIW